MKCYNHHNEETVAQCSDCHKGLCYECAHIFNVPVCTFCMNFAVRRRWQEIFTEIIKSIGVCFLGYCLGLLIGDGSIAPNLAAIFLVSRWGWFSIERFMPEFYIAVPSFLWLMFLAFKTASGLIIGVFFMPYNAYRLYKEISRLAGLHKALKAVAAK